MRSLNPLIASLLFLTAATGAGIGNEIAGIPHIQNYTTRIYKQHEQNWAIAQDHRGIMYFGNTNGLLEYDGTTWRLLKTRSPNVVRSIGIGRQNELFAGGYDYFGRFALNPKNDLEFIPVSEQLPEQHKRFGNVWNILVDGDTVYFQTDSALFRWSGGSFAIWKTTFPMNRSFLLRDTLYRVQQGEGLMQLKGDVFLPVPGGGIFAQEKVVAMIPWGAHGNLIGTRNLGLFIQTGSGITPFKTELDRFYQEAQLTDLCLLQNGSLVASTIKEGVAVMDSTGRMIRKIDKDRGLTDNTVWDIFPDNQYGLWLALNNGISRIELPAPVAYLNETSGVEGTVESIAAHNGIVYFATPLGVYYQEPNDHSGKFTRIPDFRPYRLISNGAHLIASGYSSGTYQLVGQNMQRISAYSGYSFLVSQRDPDRIYIGLDHGLAAVRYENGRWNDEGYLELHTSPVRNIVETSDGSLWLATSGPQLCRVRFNPGEHALSRGQAEYFDAGSGLSPAGQNYAFRVGGEVVIGNGRRLLTHDESTNRFIPYAPLHSVIPDTNAEVYDITRDAQGNLWLFVSSRNGYYVARAERDAAGNYSWKTDPCLPLAGSFFYAVQPDPSDENIVWFGGPDGVVRFDADFSKNYHLRYPCLLRQVRTQQDSVLWDRNRALAHTGFQIVHPKAIDRENNGLRFEFSTPFYEHESENRYQYLLEGFDKQWSDWTDETRATYTNIPAGEYQFRVRARNIYGQISDESRFGFEVLPPWYLAFWMYGVYLFLAGLLVFGLIKLRSANLEREKKVLEDIINERTAEIQFKNRQLARQTEQLRELDTLKSRFFSNISHEFRTPLTLIIGPVEEMLQDVFKGDRKKVYQIILRNARRLLRLINQLLDLSKLESGSMHLQASLQPIAPFLRAIVYSFSSLAESRRIHLEYIDAAGGPELYFDPDLMEKIIYNLLSNALKFTAEDGFITVTLKAYDADPAGFPEGAVLIGIHDTGPGIPEDQLTGIFNRFTQIENHHHARHTGSGIGLALVKELVALHHGIVKVQSEVGIGSEFDVILPVGRGHLEPSELVDRPGNRDYAAALPDLEPAETGPGESGSGFGNRTDKVPTEILILVIEDNPDVRSYICHHLDGRCRLLEAGNGREGLEMAREHLPDLIISDVMMPEMDGFELCHILKNDPAACHIPIILLTARASDEAKIEGLKCGADAYLTKPFNSMELKTRVENLVVGRQKLREKFKREILLEPAEINRDSLEDQFLRKVHELVETRMSDPAFSIDSLRGELALSNRQFYRKMQALTDHTPGQFIRLMRLKRARQLLQKKTGSVTQIAFDVGFSNLSYFTKCFREQFGRLPSEV